MQPAQPEATGGHPQPARPAPVIRLGTARGALATACAILLGTASLAVVLLTSGPAGAADPSAGTLTGNVVIIDAPAGFFGEVGVAVCPASTSPAAATTGLCASPEFAVSGSGGSYTLSLAPGTWSVREFYSIGFQGGAFLGHARTVTIAAGQTVRQNIAVRYQVPSTVSGTVAVTGVPPGVTIYQLAVVACPSSAPLTDDQPSALCATDYLESGSSSYSLPTLFKGTWLLYVGYYTEFGLTTVPVPAQVKLAKGASVTDDLSVAYQTPTNGLVEGTVTVTGAPSGFSALAGVGGCPVTSGSAKSPTVCADPQYSLTEPGGPYSLILPEGQWELAGFYELAPFGGQFLSSLQDVTVTGGSVTMVNFTVPYVAPASITSTVTVEDVPSGTTILETVLLACPTIAPYTGGQIPIECVDAVGPPSQPETIDTLPPGKWLLYPGYETAVSSDIGTTPTAVHLASGASKTKNLSIVYTP